MNRLLCFLFLLSSFTLQSLAQTDCNNYLDNADNAYKKGLFNDAISVLKSCGLTEINQAKRWQSSRLLAQCYLALNETKFALQSAEDMLEKNPLYKPSSIEDNTEFINLLHKVQVLPKFSLSLSAAVGFNINYPNVMNSYGITDSKKTYQNGKARQIGLYAGYTKSKRLSFQTGVFYVVNNYSLDYTVQDLNFKYSESLNYIQTPFLLRYHLKPSGKIKLYAQAGVYGGLLTKSVYGISRKSSDENTELKNIEQTSNRNKAQFGVMTGLGISYKYKKDHVFADNLFAEINYQYALSNINKSSNRISNQNLIYNYFYIDDDLRLNNLTFSIGYTFYLNYFVKRSK